MEKINRQKYNKDILKILAILIEKYPDIRFNQLLCNLGLNNGDRYDEESIQTLEYINQNLSYSEKYIKSDYENEI